MTSRQAVASEAALIPLFVGKEHCNVTFVLESSESMRIVLGPVKQLLIQTLLTKASLRDSLFNIMTFSNKVTCWSHHMLPCAPDTVYTALPWIRSISCSPGRDLLAALSLALTDPACHAVHLLAAHLPDQPEAALRALPALAAGRPVNIFYVQDSAGQLDINARDYLQCLTQATRGSCYVITDSSNQKLGKVIPLHVAENHSSVPVFSPVKCNCPSASVMIPRQHNLSSPLLRCSLDNSVCPLTSCVLSEFSPGSRVLARKEVDGLYYLGTVTQQVQGCTGVWVVEFDHPGGVTLRAASSQRQLVCSLDMVNHHIRRQTHCLAPGDAVLSPWEPNLRRYGPGRVIAATEHRSGSGVDSVVSLRVLMWNGCISLVPDHLVVTISASHYDRIVRELQITAPARSQYCRWLCTHSSSCTPQLFCTDCSASTPRCCSVTNHRSLVPPSCRSSLRGRTGSQRAEQDEHMDFTDTDTGRSDPEVPCSSSSFLTEGETRTKFPPALKLRSTQRPPWRYWRRTGSEPQHTKPGSAVPTRTSSSPKLCFPVPQISASPNHSSLFLPLPGDKSRTTHFKPRPPVGLRPFSGKHATPVYT